MTANSILEYILVFFGWLLNNALWNILSSTGLYLLPLFFKGLGIWLKTREEGFDEGNKGLLSLPRLENGIYVSFLVICFCCTPMFPVDISTMKYDSSRDKQCSIRVASPQDSGYSAVLQDFQGQTANVPLWWYLTHRLSKGVTQAMISSIPCGGKIRQMRFEVQHSQIKDPILTQELQDFANSCYSRAYYKLKNSNQSLSDKTINSVGWIGSDYFLNTAGYYDTYTSQKPRAAWPWNAARDTGYANVGTGGYPTCRQWWSDGKKGLKDRALASLPARVKREMQQQNMAGWEELALRWLVSPRNLSLSGGGETYTMGSNDNATGFLGNMTRLAMTVGVGMKQFEATPGFDALKMALPIVQALLEMMVIIVIPVLLVFSAYEPKTIVTITFAMFALFFIPFWWEIAGWLDDQLLTLLYGTRDGQGSGSSVPFADFVGSVNDGWIMNLVLGVMYILFPLSWFGMMGWTGVRLGDFATQMVNKGAKLPQDAGTSGVKETGNLAGKAVSQGKKLK
ncbi:conjugal transfer protein TraG [Salmonella enterica subsp. enterica serovar Pomona]|nr:conjugal transfer protein TraG [Salmonella enterica subsp. enterica serovar Pomona]EEJ1803527.1 conjugal transfer protein TraG [Salmonella enterica subsp. enterica serovar Pomona]